MDTAQKPQDNALEWGKTIYYGQSNIHNFAFSLYLSLACTWHESVFISQLACSNENKTKLYSLVHNKH